MIWLISTVWKPSVKRNAIKASISEMPVTMSASSIGMLFKPIIRLRPVCFIAWRPMAAAVPSTVAMRAERKAISRVL